MKARQMRPAAGVPAAPCFCWQMAVREEQHL